MPSEAAATDWAGPSSVLVCLRYDFTNCQEEHFSIVGVCGNHLIIFCRPFDDQSSGTAGVDPVNGNAAHHQEGAPNGAGQKNSKDATGKKREDPKPGPKKTKEKVDALSQFDLNNYASMLQISLFLGKFKQII